MIYEVDGAAAAPRARRHEASLARIVDATARLVAEDGLDALSMGKVAEAVDFTPGALYRYVDSKDALLALLVQRILDDLRGELAAAVAPSAPPLDHLAALVRTYRDFVGREPHRFGVLAIALATPRVLLAAPIHGQPATAAVIAALRPVADALIAATAAGQLAAGDPIERTLTLFALLHGLAQLPKLAHHAPGAFDVDRLTQTGVRALLLGWGGDPATVDAALAVPSGPRGSRRPRPAAPSRAASAAPAPTRTPPSDPTPTRPRPRTVRRSS